MVPVVMLVLFTTRYGTVTFNFTFVSLVRFQIRLQY